MKYSGLVFELCKLVERKEKNNKLAHAIGSTGTYISGGVVSGLNPPMPCKILSEDGNTLTVFDLVCEKEFEIKNEFYFANSNSNNCLGCGCGMQVDPTVVLTSYPPKKSYYCPECDISTKDRVEQFNKFNK